MGFPVRYLNLGLDPPDRRDSHSGGWFLCVQRRGLGAHRRRDYRCHRRVTIFRLAALLPYLGDPVNRGFDRHHMGTDRPRERY